MYFFMYPPPSFTNIHKHATLKSFISSHWNALQLCLSPLSCCKAAFMDDWEQQVWLCKSLYEISMSLLSAAWLWLWLQLWKVQFTTAIVLPFQCNLSLISRGGSKLRHEHRKWTHLFQWGFHLFKCHPISVWCVCIKQSRSFRLNDCVFLSVCVQVYSGDELTVLNNILVGCCLLLFPWCFLLWVTDG